MIKLIASDLDGTIIDSDNNISQNNFKAIEDISNNKLDFVICTGKTYPIIKGLCSKMNASYGVFGNGNQIIDLKTGKEIYNKILTQKEVLTCISIAKKENLHVHIYTDKEIITEKLLFMDLRNYKLHNSTSSGSILEFNVVNNINAYVTTNDLKISKVIISSTNSLDDVKKDISGKLDVSILGIKKRGNYIDDVINKEYEYLDISPKDTDKSTALDFLSKYLSIDKSEMMTIGDNLNDINMVKEAGVGVAVANAYQELKEVAKYTTVNPVEKGGFAEAVYKFIQF